VKESEILDDALARKILPFIEDHGRLQRMSQNAAKLSTRNAASAVVETMEKYTTAAV
jgi:UDP-N-acetylglucosamine:LPS N-acetylglucosamine transferase